MIGFFRKHARMRWDSGQAMVESALMLPVYILLFIGIVDFGTRSYSQARAAMAARHGAWLGVNGRYSSIESGVKRFFRDGANVKVVKSNPNLKLDYENAGIDYLTFAYTCGYTGRKIKDVDVSVTHSRGALGYAPSGPSAGIEFLWGGVSDYTVSASRTETDCWKTLDFATLAWLFLASGAWLDILLSIGIDLILDGIFEKFGKIGEVLSDIVYEIISRLEKIPALHCD